MIPFLKPAFPGQIVADLPFSVLIAGCAIQLQQAPAITFSFRNAKRNASWQKDTFLLNSF
jgi:hypothetical protein